MSSFETVEAGYSNLWNACQVRSAHLPALNSIVAGMHKVQSAYQAVEKSTGVPWWVIGIIDQMEGGGGAHTHLHNGDSLRSRTHNVPAGRPPTGSPPFTFLESAVDSVHYQGLNRITDWTIPRILFTLEGYNGLGYYKHGVNSPYLWSYTNLYGSPPNVGKYVSDGAWSSSAISEQAGAAAILKVLAPQIGTPGTPGVKPPPPKTDPSVSHDTFLGALNDLFSGGGTLTDGLNKLFGKAK